LAALLLASASSASAEVFTRITGENGAVAYDPTKDQGNGWYAEPASAYRFKLGFKQGERNSPTPVHVATLRTTDEEHFKGKSALELQIKAYEEKTSLRAAHKVSISSVSPSDPFAPQVAVPKDWYHSFALKIDAASYRLPREAGQRLIIEQWWQGSPFHPPVTLTILNETDARSLGWTNTELNGNFALVLRDDTHNACEKSPGEPRYFNLGPVKTGRWQKWIIHVRPDPSGKDGAVTVWLDGAEKLKLAQTIVGYDRSRYPAKPTPMKTFAIDCCLYRRNGPSTQRFFFDEIKFTGSYNEAAAP
ncbi:MAG: heparin lyase I family protein, partial [Kiritimatiellaeota bacterium]|nr:heparin lyase I family protein [Kiritimatiellota bacterium]